MKNIIIFSIICVFCASPAAYAQRNDSSFADNLSAATSKREATKDKKKKRPQMPITPNSKVIEFNNKMRAEIRPDKSVWWFGVNYRKAIMADGLHTLKDGQKIRTKSGKIVGKMPKIDEKLQLEYTRLSDPE